MEADAEIQSQTMGLDPGDYLKRGRRNYMSKGRRAKIMMGKPTDLSRPEVMGAHGLFTVS